MNKDTDNNTASAISKDGSVRIVCVDSTRIVQRASAIHHTSKTMTAALGRALTACLLMGTYLKNDDESITLKIKGDGPAGTVLCVSDSLGNVRGYAQNPEIEIEPNRQGKLNVGGAIGKGTLYVIREVKNGEPYIGISELVSGEIAEDISRYYADSEQTPTVCALGVRVNKNKECTASGGFLLQVMPFADETVICAIEKNISSIGSISKWIDEGKTPEEIIYAVFSGIEYELTSRSRTEYSCPCTEERFKYGIASLNEKDFSEVVSDAKPIETKCRFCGKNYSFNVDEIVKARKELLENKKSPEID